MLGRGHAAHHVHGPACSRCRCGAPETLRAFARINADLARRQMLGGVAATLGMFAGFKLSPRPVRAQTPPRPLLLTDLRLFNGRDSPSSPAS